jgi:hypothetical protein
VGVAGVWVGLGALLAHVFFEDTLNELVRHVGLWRLPCHNELEKLLFFLLL